MDKKCVGPGRVTWPCSVIDTVWVFSLIFLSNFSYWKCYIELKFLIIAVIRNLFCACLEIGITTHGETVQSIEAPRYIYLHVVVAMCRSVVMLFQTFLCILSVRLVSKVNKWWTSHKEMVVSLSSQL